MSSLQATDALASLISVMSETFDLDRSNVLEFARSVGSQADLGPALGVLAGQKTRFPEAPVDGARFGETPEITIEDVESTHFYRIGESRGRNHDISAGTEGQTEEAIDRRQPDSLEDQRSAPNGDGELFKEYSIERRYEDPIFRVEHDEDIYLSSDAIADYLRKVSRSPLLRAEEEVQLAIMIEVGVLARERLRQVDAASALREDASQYERLIEAGELAFDAMTRSNLRLVINIARKHADRGLDFLDVVQEGSLGLIRAIQKFDYKRGFKFSTYATWWIRQTIVRAIADQGSMIRLPVHVHESLSKVRRARQEIQSQGLDATAAAIARHSGLSLKKVKDLIGNDAPVWSYEAALTEETDATLLEVLTTEHHAPVQYVWDIGYRGITTDIMGAAIARLSPREQIVVILRFGLQGEEPMTLDRIGSAMGVTRERVRQIETSAKKQLLVVLERDSNLRLIGNLHVELPLVVASDRVEDLFPIPPRVSEEGPEPELDDELAYAGL